MASAYSIARTYNEFIPPVNLELMMNAMAQKQQIINENWNAVQSTLDMYGSMDIMKEEDKNYFVDRVNMLTNEVNNMSSALNIDSQTYARKINSYISQALDKNVISAISSTANVRKYEATIEEIKTKKGDLYSVQNDAFVRDKINKWLSDGQVGSSVGDLSYTPYKDVKGKILDILDKAYTSKGVYKFEMPDPSNPYRTVIQEYQGLEEEELMTVINGFLDESDKNQLMIDGWYNFSSASPQQASKIRDEFVLKETDRINGKLTLLKDKFNKSSSASERERITKRMESLEGEKKNFLSNIKAANSPAEIGYYMEMYNTFNGAKSMYGNHMKSQIYGTDTAYKYQQDALFKELELDLEERKFRAQQEKDRKAAAGDVDPNDYSIVPGQATLPTIEQNSVMSNLIKDAEQIESDILDTYLSQFNSSERANVQAALENDAETKNMSVTELILNSTDYKIKDREKLGQLSDKYDSLNNNRKILFEELRGDLNSMSNMYFNKDLTKLSHAELATLDTAIKNYEYRARVSGAETDAFSALRKSLVNYVENEGKNIRPLDKEIDSVNKEVDAINKGIAEASKKRDEYAKEATPYTLEFIKQLNEQIESLEVDKKVALNKKQRMEKLNVPLYKMLRNGDPNILRNTEVAHKYSTKVNEVDPEEISKLISTKAQASVGRYIDMTLGVSGADGVTIGKSHPLYKEAYRLAVGSSGVQLKDDDVITIYPKVEKGVVSSYEFKVFSSIDGKPVKEAGIKKSFTASELPREYFQQMEQLFSFNKDRLTKENSNVPNFKKVNVSSIPSKKDAAEVDNIRNFITKNSVNVAGVPVFKEDYEAKILELTTLKQQYNQAGITYKNEALDNKIQLMNAVKEGNDLTLEVEKTDYTGSANIILKKNNNKIGSILVSSQDYRNVSKLINSLPEFIIGRIISETE